MLHDKCKLSHFCKSHLIYMRNVHCAAMCHLNGTPPSHIHFLIFALNCPTLSSTVTDWWDFSWDLMSAVMSLKVAFVDQKACVLLLELFF